MRCQGIATLSAPDGRTFVVRIPPDYAERVERIYNIVDAGENFTVRQLADWLGLEPEFVAYMAPLAYAVLRAMQCPAAMPLPDEFLNVH